MLGCVCAYKNGKKETIYQAYSGRNKTPLIHTKPNYALGVSLRAE